MEIQKGVDMLEASPRSHVFLVRSGENILIDTGFPGAGKNILDELYSMGVDPKSIRKILITHHDIDHVGNVKYLRDITGAEVWAPADDIPYIMGEKSRPGVKHVFQFISKTGDPGEILPFAPEQRFGDLQVIPAPGHTPGHVIFIYQKLIFAGDLLRIINGVPAPMSKIMNADNAKALLSIGILKTLDFNWICPAHGQPARMNEEIRKFINA